MKSALVVILQEMGCHQGTLGILNSYRFEIGLALFDLLSGGPDKGSRQIGPRQIGPRQIGPLADLAANWAPHFLGPNLLLNVANV